MKRALSWAWFGPWNARSAIAEFSRQVIAELARTGHRITVFRSEADAASGLPAPECPPGVTMGATGSDPAPLSAFDIVAYNVGNHEPFHHRLLPVLARVPGIAILHDATGAGLLLPWLEALDGGQFLRRLSVLREAFYGTSLPVRFWDGGYEAVARDRPLIEPLVGLGAAVVHGRHYLDRVAAWCPGPVRCMPLAFRYQDLPPVLDRSAGDGRLVVATIGHVNDNKRPEEVLRGIAASPRLREACAYLLIGPVEDGQRGRLTSLAASLGIRPPDLTGQVPDDELRRRLRGVHAISCLRYPLLEGGSASLILALQGGWPTLVSDHGAYAEVAPGAVLRCAPGNEAPDVTRHLEWLLDNPDQAKAMGDRARAFADATYAPATYARGLAEFAAEVTQAMELRRVAASLGHELAGLRVPRSNPAFGRLAGVLDHLFGPAEVGPG